MHESGERLREFARRCYRSVAELEREMEVGKVLGQYVRGPSEPGFGLLQRLYRAGCNINWLLSGEGSMYAPNARGRELRKEIEGWEETVEIPVEELRHIKAILDRARNI